MPSLVMTPSRIAAAGGQPRATRRSIAGPKEARSPKGSQVSMWSGPGAPNQPSGDSAAVASVMPW